MVINNRDILNGGEKLKRKIRAAVTHTSGWAFQDIKDSISKPYPPAAQRGMPPHSRTGQLLNSMQVKVEQGEATSAFDMTNIAPYAIDVEARNPFMKPSALRAKEYLGRELKRD